MNKERILTTLKYFPIVVIVLELNIPILVDILIALVAIRSIYEYSNCAKEKDYHIISWIGYAISVMLAFRSLITIKRRIYCIFNFNSNNNIICKYYYFQWKDNI